jgi:hypothetical protein
MVHPLARFSASCRGRKEAAGGVLVFFAWVWPEGHWCSRYRARSAGIIYRPRQFDARYQIRHEGGTVRGLHFDRRRWPADDGRVRRVRARHDLGSGEGWPRARSGRGKTLGRPTISGATDAAIRKALKKGDTGIRKIAPTLGVAAGTVQRIKAESGQTQETLAHYASQRPTMLPKIGSAYGDANGSQWGSSAVSCKTDLTFKRLLLCARLTYWDWLCCVASAKT